MERWGKVQGKEHKKQEARQSRDLSRYYYENLAWLRHGMHLRGVRTKMREDSRDCRGSDRQGARKPETGKQSVWSGLGF